jgi:hypothetical protein
MGTQFIFQVDVILRFHGLSYLKPSYLVRWLCCDPFVYYFITGYPGQYNAMAASSIIDLKGGNGFDPFYHHDGNFFIVDSYPKG